MSHSVPVVTPRAVGGECQADSRRRLTERQVPARPLSHRTVICRRYHLDPVLQRAHESFGLPEAVTFQIRRDLAVH